MFRQFFFPSEISAPEPVAFFYKRYNYVRCLPFRDFCHFWPQANNFARSKIKQHPRQFYGQSYRNPRVYHPLAYSVSLENSPSVQLQLTDKCLSNKFRFANLST